jgi:hypothetical protein
MRPAVTVPPSTQPKPADEALRRRAAAGREAVAKGADPELTLSLVCWPPEELRETIKTLDGEGDKAE